MSKEAMKLALEVMRNQGDVSVDEWIAAEKALQEALAKEALDKMAENARELELDYWMHDHARKVWWDGEKLASKQIPLEQLYKEPAQQEPVRVTGFNCVCGRRMEVSAEQGVIPAPQRTWVGLTDAEVMQTMSGDWTSQFYFARAIEAKLKEKNT